MNRAAKNNNIVNTIINNIVFHNPFVESRPNIYLPSVITKLWHYFGGLSSDSQVIWKISGALNKP